MQSLDCFSHCSVQIGDKAYYQLKPEDKVISLHGAKGTPLEYISSMLRRSEQGDSSSQCSFAGFSNRMSQDGVDPVPADSDTSAQDQSRIDPENLSPNAISLSKNNSHDQVVPVTKTEDTNHDGEDLDSGMIGNPAAGDPVVSTETGEDLSGQEDEGWEGVDSGGEEVEAEDGISSTGHLESTSSITARRKRSGRRGFAVQPKLLKKKRLKKSEKKEELKAGAKLSVEVLCTRTTVDVMWQVRGFKVEYVRIHVFSHSLSSSSDGIFCVGNLFMVWVQGAIYFRKCA